MKELAINKLELLLRDLKINQEKEKEEGRSYFTTELFAIRIKEILKILDEKNALDNQTNIFDFIGGNND